MVIKYWMEWFETPCIFIIVKEDAFHDADLMDNESNFDISSDLGISIYSIQYLLTILVCILFTSSSGESKNKDLRDPSIDFFQSVFNYHTCLYFAYIFILRG